MKQTVAVVNPAAGGGRAGKVWEELRQVTPRLRGWQVIQSDSRGTHEELVRLINAGIERIIVFGGDGTLHLVGNLILEMGRGEQVEVGLVSVGTGSDLARTLGLSADPRASLERVFSSQPRRMDALELVTDDGRRRFVLNVASAGISGPVDEAVNARPGRGKAAYLMATLGALGRYQPARCRIRVDGEDWYEGDLFLLAVANGKSFGRGMRVAPLARLDDGEADVILVMPVPKWQLVFRLPQIYRGTHLGSRYVRWRRSRNLRIEPLAVLPPFDLDGEVFPSAASDIKVLPGALRILA